MRVMCDRLLIPAIRAYQGCIRHRFAEFLDHYLRHGNNSSTVYPVRSYQMPLQYPYGNYI